ncbi:putative lipid II flippase FtsW [Candidatus Margulisiibacteriota bacterium]
MKKIKTDYIFLFSVLALSALGLIMVFSASPTMALKLGDSYYFLKRHILNLLLGFSALYFGLRLNLQTLKKWSGLIFVLSVLLLLVVFIPGVGRKISGASRWIDLVIFSFQPSELIKFTLVLFLAGLLSKSKEKNEDFLFGLLLPITIVAGVAGIIIMQPDLGTAISIAATAFVMLFAAGAKLLHLAFIGGFGLVGALVLSLQSPYRLRRLLAFLDPWKDPKGIGFHIIQSLLAVGSGGVTGLGLGASRQKFFYLPQQFTDFIFAIMCEELGFIGGVGVVILFIIFAVRGFRIALMTGDNFSFLLATGLVSWLIIQALINLMVVVGLLPTTGIPLPFISYGGTATIIGLFSVGILLNISSQTRGVK